MKKSSRNDDTTTKDTTQWQVGQSTGGVISTLV